MCEDVYVDIEHNADADDDDEGRQTGSDRIETEKARVESANRTAHTLLKITNKIVIYAVQDWSTTRFHCPIVDCRRCYRLAVVMVSSFFPSYRQLNGMDFRAVRNSYANVQYLFVSVCFDNIGSPTWGYDVRPASEVDQVSILDAVF